MKRLSIEVCLDGTTLSMMEVSMSESEKRACLAQLEALKAEINAVKVQIGGNKQLSPELY